LWEGGQRGLQDPLELQQRFLIEDQVIQILTAESGKVQTEIDGVLRKAVVMLLAGEAFFFGGRHQLAIYQQGRGCVVVIAGDAQDVHG
jgi:hypothetical protein